MNDNFNQLPFSKNLKSNREQQSYHQEENENLRRQIKALQSEVTYVKAVSDQEIA